MVFVCLFFDNFGFNINVNFNHLFLTITVAFLAERKVRSKIWLLERIANLHSSRDLNAVHEFTDLSHVDIKRSINFPISP